MENKLLLKTKNAHTHTQKNGCVIFLLFTSRCSLREQPIAPLPPPFTSCAHEDEAIKMRPFASHFSLALMNLYFHHILEPVCHYACLIRGGKVNPNPKGWLFLFWLKWAFFSPPKELLFLQWSFIFPQSVLISRRSTVMNTATGDG